MTRLLPLLLLLAGCPSPGLHVGLTNTTSQDGRTLNTAQTCQHASEATRIADRMLVLSLDALVRSGHVKSYHAAAKDTRVGVCLVRQPEPCKFAGWTAGPCRPDGSRCARKAGCASPWHAVASLCWPPICRPDWPDEPHCVAAGASTSTGWEGRLMHEVFNAARARWATGSAATENDYSKLPALFGPGGVESQVVAAYGPLRHEITEACRGD